MRNIVLLSIFAAACVAPAFAETHLSGDIKAAALDSSGNPYIVDQDVVVPAGKKLVIKEGCVFLFKGFTGLNVAGQLHVAGTAKRPVVFTSVNDGDFNPKSDQLPNPFDWNGVLVAKESAGALLENFNLRYSVYGVKSQTTNVSVQNGVFRQNGQFHFTINEKIQYVQDNIPFTYTGTSADMEKPSASVSSVSGENSAKPTGTHAGKTGKGALTFRYVSLGVGVAGIVAGSIMLIPWSSTKKDINSITGSQLDASTRWTQLDGNLNTYGTVSVISYALGALGLIGFGVSFAF